MKRLGGAVLPLVLVGLVACGASGESGEGGAATTGTSTGGQQVGPGATSGSGTAQATSANSATQTATTTGEACSAPTAACEETSECCEGYVCGDTSLGQVCCGEESATCNTENGEDCCGNLLCVEGKCGYEMPNPACNGPCFPSPALVIERERLEYVGGSFLGICGDANHTYGYHVAAANLPGSDYSLEGAANDPVCEWHAAAIDIGMDWPASRDWLRWLIEGIRNDTIQGVAEVIGSYDGQDVRYWSDDSGWSENGIPYQGAGHDSWTHVSIYRSTSLIDHKILFGWRSDGQATQ